MESRRDLSGSVWIAAALLGAAGLASAQDFVVNLPVVVTDDGEVDAAIPVVQAEGSETFEFSVPYESPAQLRLELNLPGPDARWVYDELEIVLDGRVLSRSTPGPVAPGPGDGWQLRCPPRRNAVRLTG